MTLPELISRVQDFDGSSHYERVRLFAWYLHTHQNLEVFDSTLIRECYKAVHTAPPNLGVYLTRMAAKKPPELLRTKTGFQLVGSIRRELDTKYGTTPTVAAVTKLLSELPSQVVNVAEKVFLSETLDCYAVGAFRASIVMAWNLAFDHLTTWVLADAERLSAWNSTMASRYPKKGGFHVSHQDDFADFKESDIIDLCRGARVISKNAATILHEQLRRRNMAAHPSNVKVTQSQADHVITDLVNNIVLSLK